LVDIGIVCVAIDGSRIVAIKGIVYIPNGVWLGTEILNKGGWFLLIATCKSLELKPAARS
jgi:hypothetical protein